MINTLLQLIVKCFTRFRHRSRGQYVSPEAIANEIDDAISDLFCSVFSIEMTMSYELEEDKEEIRDYVKLIKANADRILAALDKL